MPDGCRVVAPQESDRAGHCGLHLRRDAWNAGQPAPNLVQLRLLQIVRQQGRTEGFKFRLTLDGPVMRYDRRHLRPGDGARRGAGKLGGEQRGLDDGMLSGQPI
jgi:hypothetical protein